MTFEEITRYNHYIVYAQGNEAIVRDINTNLVIDRFNIKKEACKQNLKKVGLITLAALVLAVPAIKTKNKLTNLEARVKNISLDSNPTFSIQEKEYNEEVTNKEDISTSIKQIYHKLSSMEVEIPKHINSQFVRATFLVESSYNSHAVSKAGAKGYPQTYLSTWKDVFPNDNNKDFKRGIKNIEKSTEFVIKYYAVLDQFNKENYPGYHQLNDNKKREILAAEYNAGVGTLEDKKWNIRKLPRETINHIKKIEIAYTQFI